MESVIKLKRKTWLATVNEKSTKEARRCTKAHGPSLFTLTPQLVSFAAGRASGTSCERASRESQVSLPHTEQ
ncbi:hypothetical protein QQF64_000625 [Cirrhinus molitorella]|uniref:Uncharacterized protein n=2 Tax=Cirrhinus molitorella TaxID=172907 RepID=A0ABR3NXR1_9TELE|nr:hypothetical protein Q8A67_005104 [Cirrhinus molitorella]